MSVTMSNLIMGPASIYSGAFGAAEPADTAVALNLVPPASAWTDLGGTMDGVEWSIAQEYSKLEVDQVVDRAGSRLTGREITVKTSLAEPTLNNLAIALNDGTAASGSGYQTFEPNFASSATQPTYRSLIFDGYGANSLRRRVILRKVLSTAELGISYTKDKQTLIPVTFTCHYVTSSIAPFHIIDGA